MQQYSGSTIRSKTKGLQHTLLQTHSTPKYYKKWLIFMSDFRKKEVNTVVMNKQKMIHRIC